MRTVTVEGLGSRVDVQCDGPRSDELAEAMIRAWSRALVPTGGPVVGTVELVLDHPTGAEPPPALGGQRLFGRVLAPLLQSATQAITAMLIESRAGELLMFHGAGVCDPTTGASLGFVAPGGTGKTTLAAKAGRHYGYLTDETLAMTRQRRILPYLKPLSHRVTGQQHKDEVSPDDLGLLRAAPEPWLARLVVLRRDADCPEPVATECSLFDGIALLTPETSSLAKLDAGLQFLADTIERTGPVLLWRYAEADDLLPWIAGHLEEAGRRAQP